jgi:hypothetical protein
MPASPAIDPTRCPLCGTPNVCAMVAERKTGETQGLCWCMAACFDEAVMPRIPADARGVACLCARCASSAERAG